MTEAQRRNKMLVCGCGRRHALKSCVLIRTHWYVRPFSCSGGDYWLPGEWHIVCPHTGVRNRMLFDCQSIPYDRRNDINWNAEEQFKCWYQSCFLAVQDEYKDKPDGPTCNNYYVDKRHKQFGIRVGER